MTELTSLFKALSEEKRLRIIKLLEGGELCVCDIVAALNMSQPKVSFHLNILKEAGLIKDRKDGRWIYYRINDSDMLRRFLLLTVMERIFEGAASKDSKRLGAFMKNKAKKGGAAACKSCREDIDNG